jgi:hypothetical protein
MASCRWERNRTLRDFERVLGPLVFTCGQNMCTTEGGDVREQMFGAENPNQPAFDDDFSELVRIPINDDSGEKVWTRDTLFLGLA